MNHTYLRFSFCMLAGLTIASNVSAAVSMQKQLEQLGKKVVTLAKNHPNAFGAGVGGILGAGIIGYFYAAEQNRLYPWRLRRRADNLIVIMESFNANYKQSLSYHLKFSMKALRAIAKDKYEQEMRNSLDTSYAGYPLVWYVHQLSSTIAEAKSVKKELKAVLSSSHSGYYKQEHKDSVVALREGRKKLKEFYQYITGTYQYIKEEQLYRAARERSVTYIQPMINVKY